MSRCEKRFTYDKPLVAFSKGGINDNVTGETYEFTMDTVLDLLNEQSDTIEGLILDRNRQEEKLDIARRNLSKQLEKIEELEEENEQLKREKAQLNERLRECYVRLDKYNCKW